MKKKKKALINLGIILILVSGFISKDTSYAFLKGDLIWKCFETSKAKPEECSLTGWSVINNAFMSPKQLNSKLDALVCSLGMDKRDIQRVVETQDNMTKAALSIVKDYCKYSLIIESMKNDDKSEKSFCVFTANYFGSYERVIEDKIMIEKALDEAKLPVKLDILITGSYQGRLTKQGSEAILTGLLDNADAKLMESFEGEEILSVSSYTGNIDNYIKSKGKKINLQLAMRYNEYDDRTYLWLGSPIIPFEY